MIASLNRTLGSPTMDDDDTQWLAAFAAVVAVLSLHRFGRAILYVIFIWAIASTTVGALVTGAWRAAIPIGLLTVVTAWQWYRLSRADFPQQSRVSRWTDLGIGKTADHADDRRGEAG
jgi:CHASE2 domain-containing sensor protein